MYDFNELVVGILAVWRVTHLLTSEDGPWEIVVRLRRLAGTGEPAKLLDCFYCLSLWIAAPLAIVLGTGWKQRLLLWPALSGAAILLERITEKPAPAQPAFYKEDEEDPNGLLRR